MWNYGKTPEDGAETHNQPKAFALAFVTFRVQVGLWTLVVVVVVVVVVGEDDMLGRG